MEFRKADPSYRPELKMRMMANHKRHIIGAHRLAIEYICIRETDIAEIYFATIETKARQSR